MMINRVLVLGIVFSFFGVTFSAVSDTADLCKNVVANLDCSLDPPRNICGTDGITYPTSCDFAKAHCDDPDLHIQYEGSCSPVDQPDPICGSLIATQCPTNGNPICASDGKTYTNLCELEKANCISGGKISLVQDGPC